MFDSLRSKSSSFKLTGEFKMDVPDVIRSPQRRLKLFKNQITGIIIREGSYNG